METNHRNQNQFVETKGQASAACKLAEDATPEKVIRVTWKTADRERSVDIYNGINDNTEYVRLKTENGVKWYKGREITENALIHQVYIRAIDADGNFLFEEICREPGRSGMVGYSNFLFSWEEENQPYTLDRLRECNPAFDALYLIKLQEVERINQRIRVLAETRDPNRPKPGDVVRIRGRRNKNGIRVGYGFGQVDQPQEEKKITVITHPFVPFVGESGTLNTSGGYFSFVEEEKFRYIGKANKTFNEWGSCGMCASGTVYFLSTVHVWELCDESFY